MLGFKVPKTEFSFQESKAKLCMHTQAEPHNSCTILRWQWWILDGEIVSMSILYSKLLCESHDVMMSCIMLINTIFRVTLSGILRISGLVHNLFYILPTTWCFERTYMYLHMNWNHVFSCPSARVIYKIPVFIILSIWNMFYVQTIVEYEHHCLCKEFEFFCQLVNMHFKQIYIQGSCKHTKCMYKLNML